MRGLALFIDPEKKIGSRHDGEVQDEVLRKKKQGEKEDDQKKEVQKLEAEDFVFPAYFVESL